MGSFALRDAGDVEHRVFVGQRIEAGVVAERPFGAQLAEFDVALEHDLGIGRELPDRGLALHHLDRALIAGSPRSSSRPDRAAAAGSRSTSLPDRRRCATATSMRCLPSAAASGGSVPRPVCASASACRWCARRRPACGTFRNCVCRSAGSARRHERQRDEAAAVVRPALENRVIEERELVGANHLLAGRFAATVWERTRPLRPASAASSAWPACLRARAFPGTRRCASATRVHGADFECDAHALLARERVDQHGNCSIPSDFRRAAPGHRCS